MALGSQNEGKIVFLGKLSVHFADDISEGCDLGTEHHLVTDLLDDDFRALKAEGLQKPNRLASAAFE